MAFSYRGVDFRHEFSNIGEIRSLLPHGTNVMALTATANVKTQENVVKSLDMKQVCNISKMPNNPNLFLAVLPKPAGCDTAKLVAPIVRGIAQDGVSAERHLVFCRTYQETVELFQEAVIQLSAVNALHAHTASTETLPQSHRRTCEKYDACTAENIKQHIVKSFTDPEGTVRSVFATIAFAMGLDSPNIRHVMHWGPPADIETYIQEVGRSGRDGRLATAILFYQPTDFRGRPGISNSMKAYCINASECRRKVLMRDFSVSGDGGIEFPSRKCLCCDVCAVACSCSLCQLPEPYIYFKELTCMNASVDKPRCGALTSEQYAIQCQLLEYRRQLCKRASVPSASLLVGIEVASGISDSIIEGIVNNYTSVQCKEDLFKFGITSAEHVDVFYDIVMSQLHP